jgi:hypothetical protein
MRRPLSRLWTVLLPLLGMAMPMHAQSPPVRMLAAADATLESEFSFVTAVRELPGGRVLVLDYGAGAVRVIDAAFTSSAPVGRSGQGPGEYRSPTRLLALGGDSTAVFDWGNSRLLVIGPSATPGPTRDVRGGRGCDTAIAARAMPFRASDGAGRFYTEAEPFRYAADGTRQPTDSAAIERWSSACRADTLAWVPAHRAPSRSGGTPDPFPARTQWAVAPDGRVVIVRHAPYRVDIVARDGRRRDGAPIPFARVRVTEAVRQQWRDDEQRPQAAITITRATGSVATSMMRKPSYTEPDEWPEYLPPFLGDAVQVATDGSAWVQRATAPDENPLYDVIDATGRLAERVRLAARSRIVGFGRGTVYVIRRGTDDLEYLERHPLVPRGASGAPQSRTQQPAPATGNQQPAPTPSSPTPPHPQ